MKKILVTGGSGFLGSHIADRLSSAGHEVWIFDTIKPSYLGDNQKFIQGSVLDIGSVSKASSGVDVIYHFAALADINKAQDEPVESIKTNVIGTLNLLEVCKEHEIQRFVFASSVYVHSKSGSFYRVSKHASELMIEEYSRCYGLKFTILRFGTLYGTRTDESNSVRKYIIQAMKEKKIHVSGSGKEVREYIHVYDAAEICLQILSEKYSCKTMILTGPHRIKLEELIEMINEILGGGIEVHYGEQKEAHYSQTPYSYLPNVGTKIVLNTFQDMGQGLLEIMQEVDTRLETTC